MKYFLLCLSFIIVQVNAEKLKTVAHSSIQGCTGQYNFYDRTSEHQSEGNTFNNFIFLIEKNGNRFQYTDADYSDGTGLSISSLGETVKISSFEYLPDSVNYYSVFQQDCNSWGSFINTWSVDDGGGINPEAGGYPTTYSLFPESPVIIFENGYDELWLQANITQHRVYKVGNGIGQIVIGAKIFSKSTNSIFAILFLISDTRNVVNYSTIAHDTFLPFSSTSIDMYGRYVKSPFYYGFSPTVGGDLSRWNKTFRAEIDRQSFVNILEDINKYCDINRNKTYCDKSLPIPSLSDSNDDRWDNYLIYNVAILHELFNSEGGNISQGINIKDFGIYLYDRY